MVVTSSTPFIVQNEQERCRVTMVLEVICRAGGLDDDEDARLARTDGGNPPPGAIHRPRLAVRAQVRRHSPARLQTRWRRSAVLAKPIATITAGDRRGHRPPPGARTDSRRRDDLE